MKKDRYEITKNHVARRCWLAWRDMDGLGIALEDVRAYMGKVEAVLDAWAEGEREFDQMAQAVDVMHDLCESVKYTSDKAQATMDRMNLVCVATERVPVPEEWMFPLCPKDGADDENVAEVHRSKVETYDRMKREYLSIASAARDEIIALKRRQIGVN